MRRRTFKCGKDAYEDGKDEIMFSEVQQPLYDQYGNLLDPNTGMIGTTALPNIEVIADPDDVARGRAARWYKDFGIESNDATSTPLTTNHHLKQRSEEGAAKAAAWAKDHPYLNTAGLAAGAAPFAVAAAPVAVGGGELVGQALVNPYVDAGLTSVFAAHGLNHAINEGIADWKDGVMTALEVTPLGRIARPIWNAVKPTRNFVPTLESNMSGVRYAYNRNPELAKIGSLEDYNNYLKTVFPESKVKDINYHMGPKGLQELKPSTGEVYNTNPDARGIYVTPDKSYAQRLRKYTTDRLEKPSFFTYLKRNLIPSEWDKANDVFTDIYPVVVDTKNPLLTKGSWTWGIKDKKYQFLMHDYDAIVNSGPKWYQNFNSMPEIIVPKTEQSLILGSDADVAGFRKFMSDPQNYASGKDSGIHIKPENRGKFTRLKKRTGKSASWFKAHGTPAQKKMATFALNAKKWKHK